MDQWLSEAQADGGEKNEGGKTHDENNQRRNGSLTGATRKLAMEVSLRVEGFYGCCEEGGSADTGADIENPSGFVTSVSTCLPYRADLLQLGLAWEFRTGCYLDFLHH